MNEQSYLSDIFNDQYDLNNNVLLLPHYQERYEHEGILLMKYQLDANNGVFDGISTVRV